jgi:glyoxylase-like metal-dependent hydrolase (beta-lactamase superfamily II)
MKHVMTAAMCLLALAAALPAHAQAPVGQSIETDDYIATTLAEGVYAIRHRRAAARGATSGNTTVIIGARDVLVVDSTLMPTFAKDDIALIRTWTDKPIRYLINTHWHGDHTWGNSAYLEAFPGVTIVGHTETPRLMMGFLPHFLPKTQTFPDLLRRMAAEGRDADGNPADAATVKETADAVPNAEWRAGEYKSVVTRAPAVTIAGSMTIDLGDREVRIAHLGRGNTSGDLVVFLPRERIVAAGDLLVYPFPYLLGGYPEAWAETLTRLEQLGAQTIVPGHGAVLMGADGPAYLDRVRGLLASVSAAVRAETYKIGNVPLELAKVEAAVMAHPDLPAWRERFAAGNADIASAMDLPIRRIIAAAYREVWGS